MNRTVGALCLVALAALAGACSTAEPAGPAAALPGSAVAVPAPSTADPAGAPATPTAQGALASGPIPGLASGLAQAPVSPPPPTRSPEALLRAEVNSWRKVPYRDNGTTRNGISNSGFVRAIVHGAFDIDIPSTLDDQIRTGKLVERNALAPGDLVFFDGKGFGPFRQRIVGVFLGKDDVALAQKDTGVTIEKLTASPWSGNFKTGRRMPTDPQQAAPVFDVAAFGSDRAALLHEIAKAWSGTLYQQGGTTFDGIGNDEFVRNIYEAIYDTELEGAPKQWQTMGMGVKRDALEPGDIILYEAVGLGKFVNQQHAGMYIGDGEFVHAVKGASVTISKIKDQRWSGAYRSARRIDPDVLERLAEKRALARSAPVTPSTAPASAAGAAAVRRSMPEQESRLRDAVEPWRGTPYKLGGTTKSGVDCSALVRALYEEAYGVNLPRTAEEQERLGAKIERRNLETGDLVFFRTKGMGPLFKSRHVGVYLGGGEFAQASGRLGVHVARLDNYYWSKKYEGARRLPKG